MDSWTKASGRILAKDALILVGPNFDRRISYAQLDDLSDRFARSLIRHGLERGDRVAIMLPNSIQFVVAAWVDADGYFFIEDRKKDMVVGVQHRIRGEMLVARVVLKDGADGKALKRDLHAFCTQRLSAYKVPRRIEIVAEIPKTIIGKALRRAIRDSEQQRGQTTDEDRGGRTLPPGGPGRGYFVRSIRTRWGGQ